MLTVHRSETARGLVGGLAEVLADHPSDPLTGELIVVPTRGIERWLTQELSLISVGGRPAPGITANIDFRFPGSFFSYLATTVDDSDIDRWARRSLMWDVLAVLDDHLDGPLFLPVRAFVSSESPPANRMVAAERIAGLFARYDHEYPAMLRAWSAGADTGPAGDELSEVHRWQPILWRAVRASIGVPCLGERIDDIAKALANDPGILDLPDRVSLYGFTAVSEGDLKLLIALAQSRDTHLFVLHPSDRAWVSPAPDGPRNGLLRSWGRNAEHLRSQLETLEVDRFIDHAVPPADESTLLGRLQARIRADSDQSTAGSLDAFDRSVQIHSCHGPSRQVEVVRDAILHALAEDPTLEPRDVLIMCPDVEAFAPLIEAAFHADLADGVGIPHIRVRIADRAPAAVNPLADLVARVVALGRSRAAASELIEFLDLAPVRARFWLDDDRVSSLVALTSGLSVRWGFDGSHRSIHGLDGRPEFTWASGLDRLAAGAFLSDRSVGTVKGVAPLGGVETGELDAASTLFEMINRFQYVCAGMREPANPTTWRERLLEAADLLGATDWDGAWQRPALIRDLERLLPEAPADQVLSIDEVEVVLEDLRRTRATTTNHRTGDLTVCTLMPMRSVPHRVVCLVGMDDGRFPRNPLVDGDDLLGRLEAPGLRDAARQDRQLLLDALMAAEERLIVTFSGRDERTNAPLPPAVPIAELLEEIDDIASPDSEGVRASNRVTLAHPLQPFNPINFMAGAITDGIWGFDRHMAAGARALTTAATELPGEEYAEWEPPDVIDLADLRAFLEHPVRSFVVTRMAVRYYDPDGLRDDRIPLELDALQKWGVGDALLKAELAGADREAVFESLAAEGRVPVGALAAGLFEEVCADVDAIVDAARSEGVGTELGDAVHVDLILPSGKNLVGTVPAVTSLGIERVTFSKARPKQKLAVWVDLLAASATLAERSLEGVLVGKGDKGGADVTRWSAPAAPDSADWAIQRLDELVDLYLRGMADPLPLFCETSYEFAASSNEDKIRDAWLTWGGWGEATDRHHRAIFGDGREYEDLLVFDVPADEQGGDWPAGDNRFEVLARRLWFPIFEATMTDE